MDHLCKWCKRSASLKIKNGFYWVECGKCGCRGPRMETASKAQEEWFRITLKGGESNV